MSGSLISVYEKMMATANTSVQEVSGYSAHLILCSPTSNTALSLSRPASDLWFALVMVLHFEKIYLFIYFLFFW